MDLRKHRSFQDLDHQVSAGGKINVLGMHTFDIIREDDK